MQLSTCNQARAALLQASDDINSTAQALAAAAVNVSNQDNAPGLLGVAGTVYNSGSDTTINSAGDLLVQIETDVKNLFDTIPATDDPLTPDMIAALQIVQNEVINSRQAVGQSISAVSWTYGSLATDAATIVKNTASQAVAKIVSLTGINWTVVEIVGGTAAGLLGLFLTYKILRVFK